MALLATSLGAYALSTTLGGATPGPINVLFAGIAVAGFVTFVGLEAHTPAPLVRMELLRDRSLLASIVSIGLVTTIMMATLVVGPFYLSGVLRLSPVNTGLVMSIGPAVAAITGIPAGRLADRAGSRVVSVAGLAGVLAGSVLMTMLPALMGVVGYASALATITAGYALFQAANNMAVMNSAPQDGRGVVSGLLGLARNLGLITGASAMGAVFAVASKLQIFGLPVGAATGMQATFAVAALIATLALAVTVPSIRRTAPRD